MRSAAELRWLPRPASCCWCACVLRRRGDAYCVAPYAIRRSCSRRGSRCCCECVLRRCGAAYCVRGRVRNTPELQLPWVAMLLRMRPASLRRATRRGRMERRHDVRARLHDPGPAMPDPKSVVLHRDGARTRPLGVAKRRNCWRRVACDASCDESCIVLVRLRWVVRYLRRVGALRCVGMVRCALRASCLDWSACDARAMSPATYRRNPSPHA